MSLRRCRARWTLPCHSNHFTRSRFVSVSPVRSATTTWLSSSGSVTAVGRLRASWRIFVINQMAKVIRSAEEPELASEIADQLQRLKWLLWHGNVFRALQTVGDLEIDLDVEDASPEQTTLLKAVREFGGHIEANAGSIPNYGERHRAGEAISTAFVESTSTR